MPGGRLILDSPATLHVASTIHRACCREMLALPILILQILIRMGKTPCCWNDTDAHRVCRHIAHVVFLEIAKVNEQVSPVTAPDGSLLTNISVAGPLISHDDFEEAACLTLLWGKSA